MVLPPICSKGTQDCYPSLYPIWKLWDCHYSIYTKQLVYFYVEIAELDILSSLS